MAIMRAFAGIAVANMGAATDWYARLFGRAADARPMPTLTEWHVGATGGLQVVRDADRAGGTTATLLVDDLDATVAELAGRGIVVAPATTGERARFVAINDPEGNTITVAAALGNGL